MYKKLKFEVKKYVITGSIVSISEPHFYKAAQFSKDEDVTSVEVTCCNKSFIHFVYVLFYFHVMLLTNQKG